MEWAAGDRLPGTLILPIGFAALIALTQLLTWIDAVAPVTVFVVALLALAGLTWRGRTLLPRRPDTWALVAAFVVFVAYLAPVILSADAGFAGYVLLGDPSIHFSLAERLVHDGATTSGLAPSSYSVALQSYFDTSYPTGTHSAFGTLGSLAGVDLAWTWQPFLSWMMAMGALALFELVTPVVGDRRVRALVVIIAAQPGLLYAFALQGAIKELATVATVFVAFALLSWLVETARGWRATLPLAVACGGAVGAIDVAAVAWLGPALLGGAVALWWRRGRVRLVATQVLAFVVAAVVLALPALAGLTEFRQGAQVVLTSGVELGNLVAPLDVLQALGIWPRGDFRLPLRGPEPYLLIGCATVGLGLGVAWLARGRRWTLLGLLGSFALAWWYVQRTGSPWADAKLLAILAPVAVLVAMLGAVSLADAGRRWEASALAAAIAAGVLWTNALAYHDVQLSNGPRLTELEEIGTRYAGEGPVLIGEFEEFAKYFLRDSAPTTATEPYKPGPAGTAPGVELRFGFSAPTGDFGAGYTGGFRLLVVRRSPLQSRPPAAFERIERNRFYDVWRRDDALAGRFMDELQLGGPFQRGGIPDCRAVRRLATGANRLAFVTAPLLVTAQPSRADRSPNFYVDGADPETLRATGPGQVTTRVNVPEAGEYAVWAQASLNRPLEVVVDGKLLGELPSGLSPRGRGEDVFAGTTRLGAETGVVTLIRPGGSLRPGTGGESSIIGPVTLVPAAAAEAGGVRWVAAAAWRSLCGRRLDWVEAFR